MKYDIESKSVTLTFQVRTCVLGATHRLTILYIYAELFWNRSKDNQDMKRIPQTPMHFYKIWTLILKCDVDLWTTDLGLERYKSSYWTLHIYIPSYYKIHWGLLEIWSRQEHQCIMMKYEFQSQSVIMNFELRFRVLARNIALLRLHLYISKAIEG